MRVVWRRVVGAPLWLIALVGLVTCVDGPTGTRVRSPQRAYLAFTAEWEPSAHAAVAALAVSGLPLDRVRIVIVRPAHDTLKDTTITMGPNDPPRTLELAIAAVPEESLGAALQFKSGETILFVGTSIVTAHPANFPASSATPTVIIPVFVGPGATATSVIVTPATGSYPATGAIQFTAKAFDALNKELNGTSFIWSRSDPSLGAVNDSGLFTPNGTRGTVVVTAATYGAVKGTASASLVPPVGSIVVISGDNQTGAILTPLALPLVVAVKAADGVGVAAQTVTFAATDGGTLSPASAVTNANGQAQTTLTLGARGGVYNFTAASNGFTVGAKANGTAAGSTITIVSGDLQTDTIFTAVRKPFVVKVGDAVGNPLPNTTVSWTRLTGLGTLTAPTSQTDANGLASMVYNLGDYAGDETIRASAVGVTGTVTFTVHVHDSRGVVIVTGFAYLRVNPATALLRVGDTITFTADSVSAAGVATPVTVLWASSNPGRGAPDVNGRMIVNDTGQIVVSVTRNALSGKATVTAVPAPMLTAFTFSPKVLTGIAGSTLQTSVTFAALDAGLNGITSATFTFTGPGAVTRSCTTTTPTTGTSKSGIYDCVITIPAGSPAGVWHASSLVLTGSITRTFSENALATFGSTTLTVNP